MSDPRPERPYRPDRHGDLDSPPSERCGHHGCRGTKVNKSNDNGCTVYAWCRKCGHASTALEIR